MTLENLKKKMNDDKKQQEKNPFKRTTIVVGKDGKPQFVTEHISLKEWMEDQEEYKDNPEDPEYRQEMEGEDW